MSQTKIKLPKTQLTAFCQCWRISELALFGSVLRDDFSPDSDLDVLVTFTPDADWSLLDQVRIGRTQMNTDCTDFYLHLCLSV